MGSGLSLREPRNDTGRRAIARKSYGSRARRAGTDRWFHEFRDAPAVRFHHRPERGRPDRGDGPRRPRSDGRSHRGGLGLDRRHAGHRPLARGAGRPQPLAGLRAAKAFRRGAVPARLAPQRRRRRGRAAGLAREIRALFGEGGPSRDAYKIGIAEIFPGESGRTLGPIRSPPSASTARTGAAIRPRWCTTGWRSIRARGSDG